MNKQIKQKKQEEQHQKGGLHTEQKTDTHQAEAVLIDGDYTREERNWEVSCEKRNNLRSLIERQGPTKVRLRSIY